MSVTTATVLICGAASEEWVSHQVSRMAERGVVEQEKCGSEGRRRSGRPIGPGMSR
jgi:hypothetical protein